MVPIPKFDDFEEFNRKLAEDCCKDLERKLRGQDGTKAELLEEDRRAMLPIPDNRFEARRVLGGKVNTLSLVRFDRNDYSVPTQYAHRDVILVGSLDRVKIIADSHVIGEHVRDWMRKTSIMIRSIIWPCWSGSRTRSTSASRLRPGISPRLRRTPPASGVGRQR